MRFNNYPLLMQAALEGQGIAPGWGELIGGLLADGRLVRPLAHEYRTPHGYYLAVSEGSGASEAVGTFCEWIRRSVGESGAAGAPPAGARSASARGESVGGPHHEHAQPCTSQR